MKTYGVINTAGWSFGIHRVRSLSTVHGADLTKALEHKVCLFLLAATQERSIKILNIEKYSWISTARLFTRLKELVYVSYLRKIVLIFSEKAKID